MKTKRTIIELILATVLTWGLLYGLICFNQYVLMLFPRAVRMIFMIETYLAVAAGVLVIAVIAKDKPSDFGFSARKIGMQLLWGVILGVAMSAVLTLPFHLFGLGDWVSSNKSYTQIWQFAYEFVYCIVAVGATEEFIFRGFFYNRFARFSHSAVLPIALSSVMFGLFHIFSGNLIQVIATTLIGVLFCLMRLKIKNCSTLSLIIAHGIYDALIVVLCAVFA